MRIIENAKNRKKDENGVYEAHHILPRSIFPNWKNKKSNIVDLTLREHYFVHELLVKIYPCKEMVFALWQMSMKYKTKGSREYERAKKLYHSFAIEYWNTPEVRLVQRQRQVEIWKNPKLLKKHSVILKTIMNKPEIAEKRNKGVRASRCTPVMCIQTGQVFSSIKDAAFWCGLISYAKIGECARGERKHAGHNPISKEPLSWVYVGHINKKKDKVRKIRSRCIDLIKD